MCLWCAQHIFDHIGCGPNRRVAYDVHDPAQQLLGLASTMPPVRGQAVGNRRGDLAEPTFLESVALSLQAILAGVPPGEGILVFLPLKAQLTMLRKALTLPPVSHYLEMQPPVLPLLLPHSLRSLRSGTSHVIVHRQACDDCKSTWNVAKHLPACMLTSSTCARDSLHAKLSVLTSMYKCRCGLVCRTLPCLPYGRRGSACPTWKWSL